MAFTLQNLQLPHKAKTIAACLMIAVAAFTIASKANVHSTATQETFRTSGLSMLPNYWPAQSVVGNSQFDHVQRGQAYMTSDAKYRQTLGEASTNAVSLKRVVGTPGDVLVFDTASGQMLSINGTQVAYETTEGYSNFETTESSTGTSVVAPLLLQKSPGSAPYMVYQITESQQQALTTAQQALVKTYTAFTYLKSLHQDAQGDTTITLADDEYFLLSDNRVVGVDSRYYGPVSRAEMQFFVESQPTTELAKLQTNFKSHH